MPCLPSRPSHFAVALILALPLPLAAQTGRAVSYELTFPNAAHHEAEITVTFPDVPRGQTLEARMSRSSPGRYAIHEFAKNVYTVRAEDGQGRPLRVARPNPYQWDVAGHDGTVRIHYTLFADRADGTYSGIDRTHAHLNAPATFLWARGFDARPVTVTFRDLAPGWQVATQLAPTTDPHTFTARDFQYLMDSPIEVSAFDLRSWTITAGATEQTIRLAIHHLGSAEEVDAYVADIRKVVREQVAVFGEPPRFDHGTYTFLADYLPWVAGDGMEHRNSTVLTSTGSLRTSARGLLGTVSHEFFHVWNVERIRPETLEPFDFERENMSGELWLAEGFTSYYGPLTIHRAGLSTLEEYARGLTGAVQTVLNAPGRQYHSPTGMSRLAPFVDAATTIDPTNFANTFISYYTWGAALGLAMDLAIRARIPGRSADDFMRELWRTHGRTERPYTTLEARDALARAVGDTAFAAEFWRRYVLGREAPDFAALLAPAGLVVRPVRPDTGWLGDLQLRAEGERLLVAGPVLVGTPAYEAGLERGDRLVSLDGRPASVPADVEAAVAARRPGDRIALVFENRGRTIEGTVTLTANPRVEVTTFETARREVPEAVRAFRAAWLGAKAAP